MPPVESILFLLVWVFLVPPAAAVITQDIVAEEIFEWLTAWIDRRFRGTFLARLFRCKECFVHWVIFAMAGAAYQGWAALPFPLPLRIVVSVICVFFTIHRSHKCLRLYA